MSLDLVTRGSSAERAAVQSPRDAAAEPPRSRVTLMQGFIEDSRRIRRVTVQLGAQLSFGSAMWTGVTFDVSPAGCGLVGNRSLTKRDDLFVVLGQDEREARFRANATVAWAVGERLGLEFRDAATSRSWFETLLSNRPYLGLGRPSPRRVALAATLSRCRGAGIYRPLTPDEMRVFGLVLERTPVRHVAFHSRLPPPSFARALFGLIEKSMIACDDVGAEDGLVLDGGRGVRWVG